MTPTPPFWFNQRQGKMEPAADDTIQLTAPNLKPAFISVRQTDGGQWTATLRLEAGGEPVAVSGEEYASPEEAWAAAFELYRNALVV